MIATSLNEWQTWAKSYVMLPYVQQFPLKQTNISSWEHAWREAAETSFVLESGKEGRYSYLGLQPFATIKGKGNQAEVTRIGQATQRQEGQPLDLVKQWMAPFKAPVLKDSPPFIGGCVGYWGYDVVRSLENIPHTAADDLDCPDYYFMMVDQVWIIDHVEQHLYCAIHCPMEAGMIEAQLAEAYREAGEQAELMKQQWDNIMRQGQAAEQTRREQWTQYRADVAQMLNIEAIDQLQCQFDKHDFINAVERVQHYIRQGDVFQVNLSVRCQRRLKSTPESVYEWLRLLNPSPYMGLLRFPNIQIASASPELLIKLDADKRMVTRPIGGTRKRGHNAAEDEQLAEELLSDSKECAEHLMLVDLARSDLSRVTQPGTMRVTEQMVLEHYSHVMHIVSEITGTLAEGHDQYDVLAAMFPGGTITGMPKIRTMEIIEELEPVRRGPYTGSIGWIGYDGQLEFNIAIRSMVALHETAYVQAGAGIVLASDPEREYVESFNKMQAIWQAILYSEQHLLAQQH